MKSQKGVTLTSLAIYIVIVMIVLGILAVITGTFQGNIKEIYSEGTNNAEIDKFNVYFLKEVKRQGNEISTISNNEIVFTTGNKYKFNSASQCVFLNDSIKIAENIEKCNFSTNIENERTVITVTIKAVNGEEKTIEYVLAKDIIIGNYEDESDYTSVAVPATYKTSITGLATGVTLIAYEDLETETTTDIKTAVDTGKIQAVLKETETVDGVATTYTAIVPTGFEISTTDGEDSISGGLVIKDGYNEFVWIPVTDSTTYTEDSFGPLTGTDSTTTYAYDSYQGIQYYYGDALGTINSEDAFNETFTYEVDKTNVEENIQTYGGFYVGRYETTIDGSTIGVQQGKTVLTCETLLKEGTNSTSNDEYHYRWWGLYKAQKDMYANNASVGSLMISSKQWDEIMIFTGYGDATRAPNTYTTTPDLSGLAYATDSTQYDVSKNIYDLAGNVIEFTLKVDSTNDRTYRGGYYYNGGTFASDSYYYTPDYSYSYHRF